MKERKKKLTTEKDEPINTNFLVSGNADVLNQTLLVAHGAQRCHEPAVAVAALAHIRRSRPIHVETRILKNLLQMQFSQRISFQGCIFFLNEP